MSTAGLIKKNRIALFLKDKTTNVYNRICKSQELSIAMNPETEDYNFICKEMPETVLKYYKPSISQNLVMFKDEPIFEELFDMWYNLATDDDAKRDVMIVYMFDGDNVDGYKAWSIADSTIVFDEMACTDNTLNFNINFGGVIDLGTATITDGHPTFTPGAPTSRMTVNKDHLDLVPGQTETLNISGGVGPYSAHAEGISDVNVNVSDNVVTVAVDVAAVTDTGEIIITDSSTNMITVPISITASVMNATPSFITLQAGESGTSVITGGTTPYIYATEMTGITVSISDDTVTITANNDATEEAGIVTISDSETPANTCDISIAITE